MLIDTHCHCYMDNMIETKENWIKKVKENNVSKILLPNIDQNSYNDMMNLYNSDIEMFRPMIGIHPCDLTNPIDDFEFVKEKYYANPDAFCAIGEIGLDYHWDISKKNQQLELFEIQLNFAVSINKPVSVHSRNSNHDLIPILKKYANKGLKGVLHCFTGSKEEAKQLIDIGFFLGIGGVVTYKNSKLNEVLKNIPIENILLETDSPFLSPEPLRGKMNDSSNLLYIAQEVANIYNIDYQKVCDITSKNAINCFKIV